MKWAILILIGLIVAVLLARWGNSLREKRDASNQMVPPVPRSLPAIEEASGQLLCRVVAAHEKRSPTDAPPWHQAGGEWTFLECELADRTPFLMGVQLKAPKPGAETPFVFGRAMLVVEDSQKGDRLMNALATALGAPVPERRGAGVASPQPLRMHTAILGQGLARDTEGNDLRIVAGVFSDKPGPWTAVKLFLEDSRGSAEVFFNFSAKDGIAEFLEKDTDYQRDLLRLLAVALRDGPPPERTPETDPQLSREGPTVDRASVRRVGGEDARQVWFTDDERLMLFRDEPQAGGGDVMLLDLTDPSSPPRSIAHVEQHLDEFVALDEEAKRLLVLESLPQTAGVSSSADPKRLWLVDRTTGEQRRLEGPWDTGYFGLADYDPIVSPDGRYVAVDTIKESVGADGEKERYSVFHLINLSSHQRLTVDRGEDLWFDGWRGSGDASRVVLGVGRSWDREKTTRFLLVDPRDGTVVEAGREETRRHRHASPDGSRLLMIDASETSPAIIVRPVATGQERRFPIHEDDYLETLEYALDEGEIHWVSDNHVAITRPRLSFLDVRTMKQNYATPAAGDLGEMPRVSPRGGFVAFTRDNALYIARIQPSGSTEAKRLPEDE